ncbi:unnamed protein product, partial [Brenthis ino]
MATLHCSTMGRDINYNLTRSHIKTTLESSKQLSTRQPPIPATAANLNEISQLRRRYYSAQVHAQTQRALSIPITLILRWDDHSTRPVRVKAQDRRLYVLSEARGWNTANFPTPGCY